MVTLVGPDWPSKQRLAEALRAMPAEGAHVVSWGAFAPEAHLNAMPRKNAVEQLLSFSAAGLLCPEPTVELAVAQDWVRAGAMVFGRRLRHSQGRDIQLPGRLAPRRWRRAWLASEFWCQVLPIADEWRFHIFLGRSIARGHKVQTGPARRVAPVRNRANGWTMRHGDTPPEGLRSVAKAAIEAVGYDFGAVDTFVLASGEHGVLEVNSAPGMDDHTASRYAAAIARWANGRNED
jgi:hypothetical protein